MKRYYVENLDCANCAAAIENALKNESQVSYASLNFITKTLSIDTTDIDKVKHIISGIEHGVVLREHASPSGNRHRIVREVGLFAVAMVVFVVGWLGDNGWLAVPYIKPVIFYYLAWIIAGYNVVYSAVINTFRARLLDENFLMTLTTIGAFIIGAQSEGAAVMLFYKIGEIFQEYAVNRSRRSIQALLAIRPEYANIVRDGTIVRVTPEDLSPGDEIIVKTGEQFPVDGSVIEGSSWIDTSALTGESAPRSVHNSDTILSGSINTGSVLRVKVDRRYADSSVARILDLVENSAQRKAHTEKFITTFARYYTPVVVGLAFLVAVVPPLAGAGSFSHWVYRAFVLLVISCPCALVVSIPLGYFGGIGGASRKGILVKGSAVLDALAKVRTVVFDKTGTLTHGKFGVEGVVPANGFEDEDVLMYASAVEMHSNHPVASALREEGKGSVSAHSVRNHEEIAGYGVTAEVNGHIVIAGNEKLIRKQKISCDPCTSAGTVVHVAVDGIYAGYVSFYDKPKDDAKIAVERLREFGISSVMITGDSRHAAETTARNLGISEYYAELLPEGKVAELERIMALNDGKTAFVGDGINDAPVITRADVGIAMGQFGSAAAVESADCVLMTDSPSKIPEAITHAKRTRKIVLQNIIFALGVKLIFTALGIAGIATMWEAVFADVGVALIAVANATRAMRV